MRKKVFSYLKIAMADERLTHRDFKVLFCLVSFSGLDKIFPGRNRIAKDCAIKSLADVSESLKRLEQCSYIQIERRLGRSSLYHLVGVEEYFTNSEHTDAKNSQSRNQPKATFNQVWT